jgi:hypothetical protein
LFVGLPAASQSGAQQKDGMSSGKSSATAKMGDRSPMHVPTGQTRKQTFDQLDTNHDGMISRAEAQASPDLVILFVPSDANGDGQLSPAEFAVVPIVDASGASVQ